MPKPVIPAGEFRRRCRRLLSMMAPGSAALLPAAAAAVRSRDTEYSYRQDSDFWYLSGHDETAAVLVLVPGRALGEVVLFCQPRDPALEQWTGERLGPERAQQQLAVDDAFPIQDIDDILPGLLETCDRLYFHPGADPGFDDRVGRWLAKSRGGDDDQRSAAEFSELSVLLHEMRLVKSAAELRVMREAAAVTAAAHLRAMAAARPGLHESDLEAEILYTFMRGGARHPAYECIVGGGNNACVMHYVRNTAPLRDGDLVLIDAGCEYQHYAADVTRTFPINGRFTGPQQAVYELVLAAQLAAIDAVTPGADFNAAQVAVDQTLAQGLLDMGLLQGGLAEVLETEAHKRFTVHKCSHWLGLDVHDVGEQRLGEQWRDLAPGMVLTIEPGCYLPDEADIPAQFRGLGIRIEDDLVVTAGGREVITEAVPKTVAEVEAAMRVPAP